MVAVKRTPLDVVTDATLLLQQATDMGACAGQMGYDRPVGVDELAKLVELLHEMYELGRDA